MIAAARIFMIAERSWPLIVAALAPLAAFLLLSLAGIWREVPFAAHWAALIVLIAAMGFATWFAANALAAKLGDRRLRLRPQHKIWATGIEAKDRLERDGAVRYDAVKALGDAPFGAGDGQAENPLWRAHQRAMRREAQNAKLKAPRAIVRKIDPHGARFAVLGFLLFAFVAAGEERLSLLAEGFSPADPAFRRGGVANLWIEPPAYTGKAPIYLLQSNEPLAGDRAQATAPAGSRVVMQPRTDRRLKLDFRSPSATISGAPDDENAAGRRILTLAESGLIRLRGGGMAGRWPISVAPDRPPLIRFIEPPARSDEGLLTFKAMIEDDYGLATARLRLRLDPDQERPLDAPAFDAAAANAIRIVDIPVAGARGERRFDVDLQADPWAGLSVEIAFEGFDAAGQGAATQTVKAVLPERFFSNPLARAVLEQRQTLAVSPSQWRRVDFAFNGVTLAPQRFYDDPSEYLLLRTAQKRVAVTAGGDYSETVDAFWPLALQLEERVLGDARARLEAAKEALRRALEEGANDQDLERLTEALREAMQQYLQALAQSAAEGAPQPTNGPTQSLSMEDLNEMLDSVRDLGKSGAKSAAQQALSDLENLLNNLRLSGANGSGQQGQNGQNGPPGGPAGEAADLIGRQRDLANENFRRGQDPGAQGGDLAEAESDLAGDLASLLDRLRSENSQNDDGGAQSAGPSGNPSGSPSTTGEPSSQNQRQRGPGDGGGPSSGQGAAGSEPTGEAAREDAERALGDALSDMRLAESALDTDNFEAAGSAMERAIRNLRAGAEALAESESQQRRANGQAGGGESGQQSGQVRNAPPGTGRDPLGRPIGRTTGSGVEVPGESEGDRARAVLEELRRRLSTGGRDEAEIEYLERLLERF